MSLKAQSWTIEATQSLLSLWGRENVQKQVKKSVFESIAKSLRSLGYEFSWKQCRTRVRNLTYYYRKAIKEGGSREGAKSTFQFFDELDNIFNPSGSPQPMMLRSEQPEDDYAMDSDQAEEQLVVPLSMPLREISSSEEDAAERRNEPLFIHDRKSLLMPQAEPVHSEVVIPLHVVPGKLHGVEQSESWEPLHIVQRQPFPVEVREPEDSGPAEERALVDDPVVHTSGENNDTQAEGSRGRKKPAEGGSNLLEVVALLQEEAETREDARQQRLLEHEARMEERRQKWEELRRERELEAMQKWEELRREREEELRRERELRHRQWEEQRREREFEQQQRLVKMFLQGLEKVDKK